LTVCSHVVSIREANRKICDDPNARLHSSTCAHPDRISRHDWRFPAPGRLRIGAVLGSIGIFAGLSFLFDTPADGQTLPIANNTALFSILGTDFGGNGASNFQLPNLSGIETIGAGQGVGLPLVNLGQTLGQTSYDLTAAQLPPSLGGASTAIDAQQPSLGLNYVINTEGVFPSGNLTLNSLGVVSAFAGNFAPGDELFCDGQLLQISQFSALFQLIGTTYGGDGATTFALPDLQGRDIVGAGPGFTLGEQVGAANGTLTNANSPLGSDAPVANQQPGLVMNYYIALQGIFPSEGETGNSSQQTPYLGQIVACAENIIDPEGWALCDGQLLPIAQNEALFSVLGDTYGGDGVTTFALPDLQGRTVVGTGGVNGLGTLGQVSGANAITLTSADLPALAAPTIALADDTAAPGFTTDGRVSVSGIATGAAWSYSTDGGATFTSGTGTSFTLTGDGVKNVLVNQSWGPDDISPNASLTFTLDADLLWQNANGQAAIWEMDGNSLVGGGAVSPNPGPTWKAIGTGDFNGDNLPDVLWQNTTNKQVSIWEMNGTNVIGGGNVASPGPGWQAIGTGDFNDDGDSDILFQNTAGPIGIWEMSGTNVIQGGNVGPNPGPSWRAIGTGDFNDDDHSDVLFQNINGKIAIWELNGTSVIGGGPVNPNPGPSWKAIGTGDFNGDGLSDILFQNTSTGQVSIWEMNGNALIGGGPVSANPGTSWHAIGTDGGGSDILFQNASGQASVWEMNGNTIAGGGPVSPNPGPSWHAIAV
jgi:microcystin-dependent protein